MIELRHDALVFSFPQVHPEAKLSIGFQRTLRIPDDDNSYPLPPGLGRFPLRHVDDFAVRMPGKWVEHGGVMLPMYQSEALWLNFSCEYLLHHGTRYPFAVTRYPLAVKIATGKINAVNGKTWRGNELHGDKDHVVVPDQPWLDGYCTEKGYIRQFVAMPLGSGYSAEEQLTGEADYGGLQVLAYPMKRESFEKRFPGRVERVELGPPRACVKPRPACGLEMGLAPGGRMRQEIYEDPYGLDEWETTALSRCFVHIANSLVWRSLTGDNPPTVPPTAKEYTRAGLPWFEYYDEGKAALAGSATLRNMKSVSALGNEKAGVPLPENETVTPEHIFQLRRGLKKGQVREGSF